MKNWKKLLACLLVGLMALTVFTACDASVGAPMSPKRSDAESAKALCDKFKMTYNVEMTYNEDLSEKAYSIANWIAGTSVSCSTNANKTELYRVGNANNEARAFLKEENYAAAFENLSMGTFGLNDFVPGFDIKTAERAICIGIVKGRISTLSTDTQHITLCRICFFLSCLRSIISV